MKRLKTILAPLLALLLALSLTACGGAGPGKAGIDGGESPERDGDGGRGEAYGLYIKDGEMFCSDLSGDGAWQVTGRLFDGADSSVLRSNSDAIALATVMSRDGGTLFFPDRLGGGYTLYCRDLSGEGEAAGIDSDITLYTVSGDAGLVAYLKNGDLYRYDARSGEREKLAGDVYSLYVSGDGEKILYRDGENTLYQIGPGGEREELDSGVNNIWAVSHDCETIVYQKDGALYLKRGGGEKLRIASEASNVIRAYDTGEAYFVEEGGGESTLYYFDGETSEVVTDEFPGYWVSNFYPAYDIPMLVYQDAGGEYWLAVGAESTELGAENPEPLSFTFSEDGGSFWYVGEPYGEEGALYHVPITDGRAGKPEPADGDVYARMIGYASGRLVYFKDVSDDEGTLYVDGEMADDGVNLYMLEWSEAGELLYYVDYDPGEGCGELKQYSGGRAVTVADDVFDACYLSDGSILYLTDYSSEKCRGDLYVYSGGASALLDEDVVAILSVSGGMNGYYFNIW